MTQALKMASVGAGAVAPTYVDDVFSTWLYTGNGSTQTITNGVDLVGQGGLVWIKGRSGTTGHRLTDVARGVTKSLETNSTAAETTEAQGVTAFGSTGFSIGTDADYNTNAATYASWTFRKAPKFFDVVTYTGNGSNRTIAHSLGVAPGCIMVKRTDTTGDWQVYHRSLANTEYLVLNSTAAKATGTTRWNSATATSSVFSLGTDSSVNASGGTYVAYVFAHDAASDGFIQCGSVTTDSGGNGAIATLGWEPQWLLSKQSSGVEDWRIYDALRGWPVGSSAEILVPNTSNVEGGANGLTPTATGFINSPGLANTTFVYIAIRRPNKPPTVGTEVFAAATRTGTGAAGTSTAFGQVTDLVFTKSRSSTETWAWTDRLRGPTLELTSEANTAETAYAADVAGFDTMTGFRFGTGASGQINTNATTYIDNLFRRAPGFFDVVAYTGNGANGRGVPHGLGVTPELVIVKRRNAASSIGWWVYSPSIGGTNNILVLNSSNGRGVFGTLLEAPTSTTFVVNNNDDVNGLGNTYIAYLFATLAGISKVGSFTGNGSNQTINCGFSTGARFVLIKRTDSTGDWYVWDSVRGIVSGNDPHLSLNTSAAEVTTNDTIDPATSGFVVNQVAATNVNVNAATYIYLAIA